MNQRIASCGPHLISLNNSPPRLIVSSALLLAAGAFFFFRGPYRELRDSQDFALVYSASRCWVAGLDPYQQENIDREYRLAGGDPTVAPNPASTPSVYPPDTLALVSILAVADWTTARMAWMAICTVAFLISIPLVLRSAYARSYKLAFYLLAFSLLYSPVNSGLAKGQPGVLAISLLTTAIHLPAFRRRETLGGLLVGLSCCIKPQIALPFLLFFAWQRRGRVIAAALCVIVLVSVAALTRITYNSPTWAKHWVSTVQASTRPGAPNDPTTFRGSSSYQLVNFQSAVGFFTNNPVIYNLVTCAVIFGLAAVAFAMQRPQPQLPWLMLGLLSTLVLLGSYHRYYDSQLLLLCGGGMLATDWTARRGLLGWVLSLVACLSFPLQVAAAKAYSLPAAQSRLAGGGRTLAFFALHHQPLCLLAIALIFAWLIVVSPPTGRDEGDAAKEAR